MRTAGQGPIDMQAATPTASANLAAGQGGPAQHARVRVLGWRATAANGAARSVRSAPAALGAGVRGSGPNEDAMGQVKGACVSESNPPATVPQVPSFSFHPVHPPPQHHGAP